MIWENLFLVYRKMKEKAENIFLDETWIVGDSTMGYEMD